MESSGRKKIDPRQIDEKAILEKVAALGAQGIYSSSSSKAMPARKEDDAPLPEAGGTSAEQDITEYINSHLNDFSSPGRNPLHIDKEAYRLLSDLVWIVRRKDFTIAGVASRIIIDHFREKGGLIEKIKEFYKKQLY